MKNLANIYNNAPKAGKIAIIAFVIFVLIWAAITISKALKNATKPTDSLDSAEDELRGQTGNLTYPTSQYKSLADTLEQAMTGQGTDEASIEGAFKYMQTKADVLALIKAFGVREYTDDKLLMFNVKNFNLNQWISAEMDADEKEEYINQPLRQRNIDYAF